MMENSFWIEDWFVEVRLGRLSKKKTIVRLEPQVMKVLAHLASKPNEVITKEEFFSALWDGNVTSDAALARCISRIRVSFGDDSNQPRIVETIPKIGYRLVADVRSSSTKSTRPARWKWLGAAAAGLALSFLLVGELFGPTELRSELNTDEAAAEAYRIGLDLYKKHTYPYNQNSIAHLEKALEIDPDFGLALAALSDALVQEAYYWAGEREVDALRFAQKAVELEPARVESHRALGKALSINGEEEAALGAFQHALELEPNDWHSALQSANLHFKRLEFDEAESRYLEALDHAPNLDVAMSNLGYLYLKSGDVDAARHWFDRALERYPLQQQATGRLAMLEMFAGEANQSRSRCARLLESYPNDYLCLQLLAIGELKHGDLPGAQGGFARVLESFPDDRYARLGKAKVLLSQSRQADAAGLIDDVLAETIRKISSESPESYDYWIVAGCHALLDDAPTAYEWLDRAAETGRRFPLWDANDPVFDNLQGDSRFDRYIAATHGGPVR